MMARYSSFCASVSAPAQELRKSGNGDDGGFELVGKIVDEIASQHLGVFQFLRHGVEALRQLLKNGVVPHHLAIVHSGREISRRQTVYVVDQPVKGAQRNFHGADGNHAAHQNADEQHHDQHGKAGVSGNTQIVQHPQLGQQEGQRRRNKNRRQLNEKKRGGIEQRQRPAALSRLFAHTFFTAL